MNDALKKLPLFATDRQIALAIVGSARADKWMKNNLPVLEAKSGFPRIDPLHGGRPVALIWKWYERYMMLDKSYIPATLEDGKENLDAWRITKRERREDRKPKLNLSARSQNVLQLLIDNPMLRTVKDMRGVGEKSLAALEKVGAIVRSGTNSFGDQEWDVTEEGRTEIKRIAHWYYGKPFESSGGTSQA